KALKETRRVSPLDSDLAKGREVDDPHPLAQGLVLGRSVAKPVLPLPVVAIFPLLTRIGEPVGAFPPRDLAEYGTALFQMFMQGRSADTARGFGLPIGEMVCIGAAQRFRNALAQIAAVPLERLRAADVDIPKIKGRLAVVHPLGQRHASATRGDD